MSYLDRVQQEVAAVRRNKTVKSVSKTRMKPFVSKLNNRVKKANKDRYQAISKIDEKFINDTVKAFISLNKVLDNFSLVNKSNKIDGNTCISRFIVNPKSKFRSSVPDEDYATLYNLMSIINETSLMSCLNSDTDSELLNVLSGQKDLIIQTTRNKY
jgi:ribosomal protein S20